MFPAARGHGLGRGRGIRPIHPLYFMRAGNVELSRRSSEPQPAASSTSSSSSTSGQPEAKEDMYKNWDPMAEVYNSPFNQPDFNFNDMFVTTIEAPDVYCEFDLEPGSKYCWKKWHCYRPHRPSVPLDGPSTKARVMRFGGFPSQRPCPLGISFVGKVVHVVNPHEFYIIPEADLDLTLTDISKKNTSEGINVANNADNPYFGHSGLKAFDNTMKDLQRELSSIATVDQHNLYSRSEVVAAKVQLADKSMQWCRAVVTTKSPSKITEITLNSAGSSHSFGIPSPVKYGLTLMDSGEKVTCGIIDMAPLPMMFAKAPSYAYKCTLHGVLPVCDIWCAESVSHFKTLVEQKEVLVEVKRMSFSDPSPLGRGRARIFNEQPCEVGLRVKDVAAHREDEWKSVEKELLETHLAVPNNLKLAAFQRQVALQKRE